VREPSQTVLQVDRRLVSLHQSASEALVVTFHEG
jgi:hypothetical protein